MKKAEAMLVGGQQFTQVKEGVLRQAHECAYADEVVPLSPAEFMVIGGGENAVCW